jgi:putative hydrolase of the HAD superfamily
VAITAVLIDLDDTLVVEEASAEASFLATCALAEERYGIDAQELHQCVRQIARELWHRSPARAYCVSVGISSWEALWARFLGQDPNLRTLRAWVPIYRSESWSRALAKCGVDDDWAFVELLAETFRRDRRARHVVYDDVEPALQALRKSYRLALITNGAPDLQRTKLAGSGLEPYFEHILVAGEVGVGKPDPAIFGLALERLGVKAKEAVMVGNSLRSDIGGAQGADIRAIWLNREAKALHGEVEPDAEIVSLEELCDVLPACNWTDTAEDGSEVGEEKTGHMLV